MNPSSRLPKLSSCYYKRQVLRITIKGTFTYILNRKKIINIRNKLKWLVNTFFPVYKILTEVSQRKNVINKDVLKLECIYIVLK